MASFKSRDGRGHEIVWFTTAGGGDRNKPCNACGHQQNVPPRRNCNLRHRCPAWQFAIGNASNAAVQLSGSTTRRLQASPPSTPQPIPDGSGCLSTLFKVFVVFPIAIMVLAGVSAAISTPRRSPGGTKRGRPASMCGNPTVTKPVPSDWTSYSCQTKQQFGRGWSKRCLRRKKYTPQPGAGCPGNGGVNEQRCCPAR